MTDWKHIARQIMEAPISDFGSHGDLNEPGSFRDTDLKAIRNPKWVSKVYARFEKAPVNLNIQLVNIAGGRYAGVDTSDVANAQWYARGFDGGEFVYLTGKEPDPNAVNVVLISNEGDERIALTPWMVGHRLSHSLAYNPDASSPYFKALGESMDTFLRVTGDVMDSFGLERYATNISHEYRFNQISMIFGTTRAARQGMHTGPGEWLIDMMTQWLGTGHVRFRRPDILDGPIPPRPETNDPFYQYLFTKVRDTVNYGKSWLGFSSQIPASKYQKHPDFVGLTEDQQHIKLNKFFADEVKSGRHGEMWIRELPNVNKGIDQMLSTWEETFEIQINRLFHRCIGACFIL